MSRKAAKRMASVISRIVFRNIKTRKEDGNEEKSGKDNIDNPVTDTA